MVFHWSINQHTLSYVTNPPKCILAYIPLLSKGYLERIIKFSTNFYKKYPDFFVCTVCSLCSRPVTLSKKKINFACLAFCKCLFLNKSIFSLHLRPLNHLFHHVFKNFAWHWHQVNLFLVCSTTCFPVLTTKVFPNILFHTLIRQKF